MSNYKDFADNHDERLTNAFILLPPASTLEQDVITAIIRAIRCIEREAYADGYRNAMEEAAYDARQLSQSFTAAANHGDGNSEEIENE